MRAAAQRLVWIIGLFCLSFGAAGVLAFSPVTIALAVTGWFLAQASYERLAIQGDIYATSPDLQYWARNTLLRTVGIMFAGAALACVCVVCDFSLRLSLGTQAVLTFLLICTLIVVTRIAMPGFFAASWEVHGVRERRKRQRSTTIVSRILVRAVAALLLVTSMVGTFTFLESLKRAPSQYARLSTMARTVSGSPSVLEALFSPTQTSPR